MSPESEHDVTQEEGKFGIILPGLLMLMALAALDQNIVSTALPQIVGSLGGLSELPWVVTAFMLTSTVTTPLYGNLSDMFGRRSMIFLAVIVFVFGSLLCGAAANMPQLIIFRAAQGLGAGGLVTLAQTTLGDFVSPRDRARYSGYFSAVFTLCSVAGPLAGGIITELLSWRYIFFVNVPIAAVALTILHLGLPRAPRHRDHAIDFLGIVLLTVATTAVLVMFSSLGGGLEISPPIQLALGIVTLAGLLSFLFWERRAAEPVIPLGLFRNRSFVVATVTMALNFAALGGVGVFLPLFFQSVVGMSPSQAGMSTVPLMAGLIVSSVVGGRIAAALGRYKFLPIIGLAVVVVADIGLSWSVASVIVSLPLIVGLIVLLGLGSGLILPVLMTVVQNAVDPREMGSATATTLFFRSLAATFGVALAGAVMNSQLQGGSGLAKGGGSLLESGGEASDGGSLAAHLATVAAYQHGLSLVYGMAAAFVALGFLCVLFLPERPIKP